MASLPQGQFICLGVVSGAIGIRGELRIRTFTETPLALADYGPLTGNPDGKTYMPKRVREVKGGLGVFMEGITDRNAAEELKGLELGIARTALGDAGDEDDFFLVDLIGLSVQDEAGQPLGTVKWVHDFGAGDVLELQLSAQKKTEMAPFSIEAVPEVNVKEGYLVVRPSAWQVPDEEKEGEGE